MPIRPDDNETSILKQYILSDFSGGLHSAGITSEVAIADTDCTCAINVELYPRRTVSKRMGRIRKNTGTPLSGAVTQIYQYYTPGGANYLMIWTAASGTCSGQVHEMKPADLTTCTFSDILSSGQVAWKPEEDNQIAVESFAGSAIFCDGVSPMYTFEGAVCSGISTAPSGVRCIKAYKGYLFVGNIVDVDGTHEGRIQWSNPNDAHSWPASNWIDLDPGDGDPITAMEVLGNELIVFKEYKIYAVTYVGGYYTFLSEVRVDGVGCCAPASISSRGSDLTFYSTTGFYSFNGRDVEELTPKVKDIVISTLVPEYKDRVFSAAYDEKSQIWNLAAMTVGVTGCTHIFCLDYSTNAWLLYENSAASIGWYNLEVDYAFEDMDVAYGSVDFAWGNRAFLSNATLLLTGTYDGYIEQNDSSVTSDAEGDYEGYWKSRWLDFDLPENNKRIIRLTFFVGRGAESEEDSYDLNVDLYTDYDSDTPLQSKTIALYGTDLILEKRIDTTFSCRALQIKFGTTLKEQPFTVHKIIIEYIPKGRTKV